jgi:large subunit ribosomal protein L19
MNHLAIFEAKHAPESRFADLKVGWTVKIHQKIKEGTKSKNQVFEGIIIARKHGNSASSTITVRRVAGGFGVEKTIPLRLPTIEKIEVIKRSKVRRAKLYYLRDKTAKEIRRKTKAEMVKAASSPKEEAQTEEVKAE